MVGETTGVSLAHTAPFAIGPVWVNPAAREVECEGVTASVEPLVMQVLIVLAQSAGEVVARDTLIDRCWDGRAISEDALNRVVAKVRRLGETPARGTFHIETVTKVGYRLRVRDGGSTIAARLTRTHRPYRLFAMLLGGAVLAGVPLAIMLQPTPRPPRGTEPQPPIAAATDLETRGLSLLFQGTSDQTEAGLAFLRQATALAPRRASLWGSLAMGYVLSLSQTDAQGASANTARAIEASQRALSLDPRDGRAIAARIALAPTFGHWKDKDRLLRAGLARASTETPPLLFQRAQYLASVGRTDEALAQVQRLDAISPLLPWIQSLRAHLLAAQGRLDAAQQVADHAATLWPRDRLTWFTRCDLALYGGRPREALAMGEERSALPAGSAAEVADRMAIARLLIAPSPVEADRLLDRLAARARTDRSAAETAVQAAAALARPERALSLARAMYTGKPILNGRGVIMPRIGADDGRERNTALLFWGPVNRLRGQPGYAALLRDLGLTH